MENLHLKHKGFTISVISLLDKGVKRTVAGPLETVPRIVVVCKTELGK